jgi:2-hydroxychromene-2-carboxylate isomerase
VPSAPVFFYDVSSPYAWLAAERLDTVLPRPAVWQPIVFGAVLRHVGKVPWSFREETKAAGIAEVERRAQERGLGPVRWPPGWPVESYSVAPLRAILVAREHGLERALTLALYRCAFHDGRALNDEAAVLEAADRAGLDREEVRAGIARQDIKDRLRAATDDAIAQGVTGVPTIAVGERLFWGDDRLEEAAAILG